MTSKTAFETTRIFPVLRYRDAHAMIEWLQRAFGFRRHALHEDGAGGVAHAQLAFGTGLVMLSTARDDDFGRLITAATAGAKAAAIQVTYLAVDDLDAHHAVAVAAGAEILMPPTDQDYGSRDYICRDPEGNVWCFGTYWPQAQDAPVAA